MAGNKIAELFAEVGFRVDRTGLKKFRTELDGLAKEFDSNKGITGSSDRARKSSKRFMADVQKNYSKLRPSMKTMKADLDKVNLALAGDLSSKQMKDAVDLRERITRDSGREYEKRKKAKISEEKATTASEKRKQSALNQTRSKLIQVTKSYDSHKAKLMQVRDSVKSVNRAYRDGHITMERRSQQVKQLTAEYRRLQAAQAGAAATSRAGSAGGAFAGGADPRQAGSHRLISAIHSDAGLGAMAGGFAIAQSTMAYQGFKGMEQGLIAATGSAEKAQEEMKFLIQTSRELGLFVGDLGRSFSNFSAAARGSNLQGQEIRDTFYGVAAQARVLNLSAADTEGVMTALTQMMNKGQVMAEELKNQMGERLPGSMQAAARAAKELGITTDATTESLFKAMENGELMADEFLPVFSKELLKAANEGGALEEAMNSTSSALGRFQTNVWLANKILQEAGLDRGVRKFVNETSNAIARSDAFWRFMGRTLEMFMDALRGPMELIGALTARFADLEKFANSLGLEIEDLAMAIMALFKWGRRVLFIFWLLPAALSGVGKIIDGQNLSWAEWAITIAGAVAALRSAYKLTKKWQALKGKTGAGPATGSSSSGSGRSPAPKESSGGSGGGSRMSKLGALSRMGKIGALIAAGGAISELLGGGEIMGGDGWSLKAPDIKGMFDDKNQLPPLLGPNGGVQPGQLPFGPAPTNQNNVITIEINGAQEPEKIAWTIEQHLNRMVREASASSPIEEK